MSIAEFSATIRSHAYIDFFNRVSTDVVLKTGVEEIRATKETAEKTSFYITEQTIGDIIAKLSGTSATPEQVNAVFAKLQKVSYSDVNKGMGTRKGIKISEPYIKGNALYYPRMSFKTITRILDEGFSDILAEAKKKDPKISIGKFFQKGHVFGIFPKAVSDVADRLARNSTMDERGRTFLLNVLRDLAAELERQDLETSNLQNSSYTLYSKYQKSKNKFLVEMQLAEVNQTSGRAQSGISKALRKFFNKGTLPLGGPEGLKFGTGEGEQLLKKIISTRGSPSMIELMTAAIVDTLSDKKASTKVYSIPKTAVKRAVAKVNVSEAKKAIKSDKQKVSEMIRKVKAIPSIHAKESDVFSIETFLKDNINATVEKNMGTGASTRLLNYRTGRFSDSVTIEAVTQGRTGMLSVFYNYMRYPYATFSEGGKQQYPRTRDPKILISTSIRELVQSRGITKLRSILV